MLTDKEIKVARDKRASDQKARSLANRRRYEARYAKGKNAAPKKLRAHDKAPIPTTPLKDAAFTKMNRSMGGMLSPKELKEIAEASEARRKKIAVKQGGTLIGKRKVQISGSAKPTRAGARMMKAAGVLSAVGGKA